MKIAVGRTYRLRNGALARVVNVRELPYADPMCGARRTLPILVGYLVGSRQKVTWGMDGYYSPVAGVENELDIVGRATRS